MSELQIFMIHVGLQKIILASFVPKDVEVMEVLEMALLQLQQLCLVFVFCLIEDLCEPLFLQFLDSCLAALGFHVLAF